MSSVAFTKEFNKCLRDLLRGGKKGKDAVQRARAAQAEAAAGGAINTLQRTHHGESRFPNAEKYDLGDGYRLVVQLVDGRQNVRAFLFAGDHEDAERWLENHRDYVWVRKSTDGSLEFVQVSKPSEPRPATLPTPLTSSFALRVSWPRSKGIALKWNTIEARYRRSRNPRGENANQGAT
jgi:hypothetical protein